MALQLSVDVRNARADVIETTIGTSPTLSVFTGSSPANTATANSGTTLVSMTLPSNWMGDASDGSKAMAGTWTANASANGTAGYFRLFASGGTCHAQGNVTVTGGGGDMTFANVDFVSGQEINITGFTLSEPNG